MHLYVDDHPGKGELKRTSSHEMQRTEWLMKGQASGQQRIVMST